MGQVDVFEIPRRRAVHLWLGAAGVALLGIAALVATARQEDWLLGLVLALPVAFAGGLLAWGNARAFVTHPPQLRATREGVWFGAGATVPWHEVAAIYEAGVPIQRYGFSVRTQAINLGFRRRRTLLRVPSWLWLTTLMPATVKISLYASELSPSAVVARLEALRLAACGHENGVLPGTSEVPAARVVVRP